MLDQVLSFFEIEPNYDLDLMRTNQSLFDITADGVRKLESVFSSYQPDYVFVQGDTTTTFVAALCAYYAKSKVVHVEAGLRSHDKFSPFPEEINRSLTARLADYHFAPTEAARRNLEREGIVDDVWVVGNTVIDALLDGLAIIERSDESRLAAKFQDIDLAKRIVLVTAHRRESFGQPYADVANALKKIAQDFADVRIIYPVHPNPNVKGPAHEILGNEPRIHLIEPLDYPELIWLMKRSYMLISDSGGIQEEAPSLGKPVLVIRDVTERTEGIAAGTAKLVGTNKDVIYREASALLTDAEAYCRMSQAVNPYGDGTASKKILQALGFSS
jgi:UDP-N-acetylglucosamine 2-epimerase (non-hydrolysing)